MKKYLITGVIAFLVLSFSIFFILTQEEPTFDQQSYSNILEYGITTEDQRVVLKLVTQSAIPEKIHDIVTDSNVGFGYVWLWNDTDSLEHHGGGHLKGYIANIHRGDFLELWHMESVLVTIPFDVPDIDFCLTDVEEFGVVTINNNELIAKTPLKYSTVHDKPIEKIGSFSLVNYHICHSGFGGIIIDDFIIEN